ncbi:MULTISPECIES: thiol:disulfide interchange protein DsbA/DsbL [Idiomarinaceae]|uniref:Thiol:disulfide interchange protein n=4 Tax=Pseudidiomarina TaxID=2800384 RepID=A0A368UKI8_9GAMM|nr:MULTISPECIES: thiol:disulfide interchange protein DsbA/DsbL [Idiomarinaceae]MDT7525407.1 thiol:disulfide interchange protein DsbA/DsbL [Pseudidiomarina sp. GXY010]MDX1526836.1 thiol:disulfide interchange protein DsbA/DsbL [Pseudidiomarina maritima]MRJ43019.1 thioredoxin domain-containing protein [Idiomarina sp. FeN1]NCU58572.1 thioredoxin domain-containing protein [Idiomarina sp. FenA--70]NCU61269.1 thioredoxin domain-containing protein [Idiomarina sp. FenBw--71]
MKKLMFAVLALFMLPAAAQQFEQDVHYEVIAEQATDTPQVHEFFSFYCVHCYRFEGVAEALAEAYPEQFKKSHVSFINYQGMGLDMSRAYIVARQFNKEKEISKAIFSRNFAQRKMIGSKEDLHAIFEANGISASDLDKAMNSFSVRGMANKMDRDAQNLQVNATPTFIVNGKYRLKTEGFRDSNDFVGDFVKAVGYLLEQR